MEEYNDNNDINKDAAAENAEETASERDFAEALRAEIEKRLAIVRADAERRLSDVKEEYEKHLDDERTQKEQALAFAAENTVKKLKNLEQLANERYEALQREYANFRKRNQDVAAESRESGFKDAIAAFLPVFDGFDLARKHVKGAALSGFEIIEKQAIAALTALGVEEVKALGEDFDMATMNAVMREENPDKAGKVLEVFLKGYARGGKVIRHAVVKIGV
ncbi:MAG: nucleotide exchange factor GrpE [Clostridiaceae bacterium]|jgi:molecular chaperone GrpE|nr:nucleotide exchange factor GrpE [Clostridiaceae bacterium]